MIPKVIHYIWFGGGQLSPLAKKCMESWERYCPDYVIKRWDESNFDVNCSRYCAEAYNAGKWAFASDYARLWVLVNYGGVYMDVDVELVAPIDEFLAHQAFAGFESASRVSTGILAAEAHHPLFVGLLEEYDGRRFVNPNGSYDDMTNVIAVTKALLEHGLHPNGKTQTVGGLTVFPVDYFCPKDLDTNQVTITANTRAIHHFDGSWVSESEKALVKKKWEIRQRHRSLPIGLVKVLAGLAYLVETRDIKALVGMVKKYWIAWRTIARKKA